MMMIVLKFITLLIKLRRKRDDIVIMLKDVGMNDTNIGTLFDLCDIRNIDDLILFLGDNDETYLEMKRLFTMIGQLGIGEWIVFDVDTIRGLSYYTGIVFEGFSKGCNRSICGGGRYDRLLELYNKGQNVPAIGFGMGDVVLLEILEELKIIPKLKHCATYLVVPYNKTFAVDAIFVSQQMRGNGAYVELFVKETTIGNAFKYAHNKGIDIVVLIVPDEWRDKKVVVKYMNNQKTAQKQRIVDVVQFLNELRRT